MPRPFKQLPSSVFATGIAPHKNIFIAMNNDFLLQNNALKNLVPSLTSNVYGCVLTTHLYTVTIFVLILQFLLSKLYKCEIIFFRVSFFHEFRTLLASLSRANFSSCCCLLYTIDPMTIAPTVRPI